MMIEELPYPILTNVLKVISAANESLDAKRVRRKVLHAFYQSISAEGAILFLPNESGRLASIILKDLEKAYCNYYKTYYYRFDSLQLTHGLDTNKEPTYSEKTFRYDSFQPMDGSTSKKF